MVPPNDTILTLSYEYLQVSSQIAGCFLSRLRPVTKGLGNISTTLDPCWKGMLLLSINNPSNKKIKLVISQLKDDVFTPNPIVTMLLWKIEPARDKRDGKLTFHLDNPAMRTDIWAELSAEPYRLFHGRHYKRFQELIQALTTYQPTDNHPAQIVQLQTQLQRLLIAVRTQPRNVTAIQESLLNIYLIRNETMPAELVNKLNDLFLCGENQATDPFEDYNATMDRVIGKLSDIDLNQAQEYTDKFLNCIYMLFRECNYQKLCNQVTEIHNIIKNKTQYRWRLDGFKYCWYNIIRPHFSGILASGILAVILLWGKQFGSSEFFSSVIISILPTILSLLLDQKHHQS